MQRLGAGPPAPRMSASMVSACSNCGEALATGARFCPACGTRVAEGETEAGLIGKVFNAKYRLLSEIGEGSMGKVFLGEHLGLKKRVALKVLHGDLTLGEEVLQRFQREGIAAGKFSHPNAIQVFDFDRSEEGLSYLAMEYVEGQNLREHLSAHGAMEAPQAVDVILQVLAALAEAHGHGIVHRDLKPENIMVLRGADQALHVKVLDFGLSKLVDRPLGASLVTQPGRILGTPLYMAPEQAGGEDVDHRSDLYAVGLILYELLAGQGPFQGESFTELLVQQATQAPPSLAETRPELEVSGALEAVLDRSLAKLRDERYQSAGEMIAALEAADLAAAPRPARRRRPAQPAEPRAPAAGGRRGLYLAAGAGALLLAAGAAFLLLGGEGGAAYARVRLKPAAERDADETRYVTLLDEARSSLRNGAPDVALAALEDARTLPCEDAEVYVVRALAYRAQGDLDTASADLRAALEADPGYAEAAAALGWLELDRGRDEAASEAFDTALAADEGHPAALAGRAALLWAEPDGAAEAEALLRRAVQRDKSCAPAQHHLGLLLLERGDHAEAIDALVEAKRSATRDPGVLSALGDAYRAADRPRDAETQYRAALDLDGGREPALYGLASLLAAGERFADTVDVLERPLEEEPDRPRLQVLYASALEGQGRVQDAVEALERAMEAGVEDADACTLLALLSLGEGDARGALEAAERALALDDTRTAARRARGLARYALQDYGPAAEDLEQVLVEDPDDAYAHLTLGVAYMEFLGQRDRAREHFEAYRDAGGEDPRLEGWLQRVR